MSQDLPGQQTLPAVREDEKDTALATQDVRRDGLMQAVFGQMATKELHNFTGTDEEKWKLLSLATGPKCKSFDDLKDSIIEMRYFYVHRIEIEAEKGGEVFETTRTVLIGKNLEAYAFVSDGVARDLARIIQLFGLGPYNPPKRLRVESVKTRHGFRTYTIVPA